MAAVPTGGTVAATGTAGFIGGLVAKLLLDRGYRVKACLINATNESRLGFLKDKPGH